MSATIMHTVRERYILHRHLPRRFSYSSSLSSNFSTLLTSSNSFTVAVMSVLTTCQE